MRAAALGLFLLVALFCTAATWAGEGNQTLTLLPERQQAPGFALKDINGETHRLADYRGRVVIVNFWATWCPPCREELPSMQRAWEQIRDEGIAMLGVNVGENADTIFPFTAYYPVEFPLLMDLDSKVVEDWPVIGLPTTFVLDPEGRLVYRAIGGRRWDDPQLLEKVRGLKARQ
jgi:peroxiredoxin